MKAPTTWSPAIIEVNNRLDRLYRERSLMWKRLGLSRKPEAVKARQKDLRLIEAEMERVRAVREKIIKRDHGKLWVDCPDCDGDDQNCKRCEGAGRVER